MTREDENIRHECVRGSIGVAWIVDKMKENRQRCFGHAIRRAKFEPLRMIMEIKC